MKIFYSSSTKGFYVDSINKNIPVDAIEISKEQHQELLNEQSQGKEIKLKNGGLIAELPPPLTKEEKKAQRKAMVRSAMRAEADDLAFEVLAGEIDKQVWLDKRAEIKQRFPKEE